MAAADNEAVRTGNETVHTGKETVRSCMRKAVYSKTLKNLKSMVIGSGSKQSDAGPLRRGTLHGLFSPPSDASRKTSGIPDGARQATN